MKKLVILFFIMLTLACNNLIYDNSPHCIIRKVEYNSNRANTYKYRVYINSYLGDTVLYTDTKFNVGDTIKFVPKSPDPTKPSTSTE